MWTTKGSRSISELQTQESSTNACYWNFETHLRRMRLKTGASFSHTLAMGSHGPCLAPGHRFRNTVAAYYGTWWVHYVLRVLAQSVEHITAIELEVGSLDSVWWLVTCFEIKREGGKNKYIKRCRFTKTSRGGGTRRPHWSKREESEQLTYFWYDNYDTHQINHACRLPLSRVPGKVFGNLAYWEVLCRSCSRYFCMEPKLPTAPEFNCKFTDHHFLL